MSTLDLRQILLPVDGSEGAAHAARFAARLARTAGAAITLMYVLHPVTATAEGLASKSRDEAQAILRRAAAPSFRSAAEAMGPVEHPLHVREVVELGDPAGKIVAYARANPVDIIVMGSRGLSPFREILIGSVSDKVVRHAPCPVTVVR